MNADSFSSAVEFEVNRVLDEIEKRSRISEMTMRLTCVDRAITMHSSGSINVVEVVECADKIYKYIKEGKSNA